MKTEGRKMKKLIISILSLLMAVSLTACSSAKEETFEGSAQGYGGTVTAKVTFKADKITAVEVKAPDPGQPKNCRRKLSQPTARMWTLSPGRR